MKAIVWMVLCTLAAIVGGCGSGPSSGRLKDAIEAKLGKQTFVVTEIDVLSQNVTKTNESETYVSRLKVEITLKEDLFKVDRLTEHSVLITPRAEKNQKTQGFFVVTATPFKDDFRYDVKIEDFKDPGITASQLASTAGTRAIIRSDSVEGRSYIEDNQSQAGWLKRPAKQKIIDVEDVERNVYFAAFPVTRDWSPWISIYFAEYMREKNNSWVNCSAGVKFQLHSQFAFNKYTIGGDDGESDLTMLLRDDKSRGAYSKKLRVRSDESYQWCRVCLFRSKFADNNRGCRAFAGQGGEVPDGNPMHSELSSVDEIR